MRLMRLVGRSPNRHHRLMAMTLRLRGIWRNGAMPVAFMCHALATAACGPAAPPAHHPPATLAVPPGAHAATAPLLVEYVVVHQRWVEKFAPGAPSDIRAWSEAPENADAVRGPLRHILVRVTKDE